VAETADGAVATAGELTRLFDQDRQRLHEALKARPILKLTEAVARSGLSFPVASSAMDELLSMGIASELTGKKRNRVFAYDRYLATLAAGT
jgi:Fic family protein